MKKEEKVAYVKNLLAAVKNRAEKDDAASACLQTCEGHTLSRFNTIACIMQKPDVSLVGGFQQWRAKGRIVRKGERGFTIFFPCFKKNEETGEEALAYFRTATVFDISQTEPLKKD